MFIFAYEYKQAVYWWTEAANHGFPDAQYSLGLCYKNGYGVEVDCQHATFWFMEAVESHLFNSYFLEPTGQRFPVYKK